MHGISKRTVRLIKWSIGIGVGQQKPGTCILNVMVAPLALYWE